MTNTIRKESQTLVLLIQILFHSTCEVILELILLLLLAKVPIYAEKCSLNIFCPKMAEIGQLEVEKWSVKWKVLTQPA